MISKKIQKINLKNSIGYLLFFKFWKKNCIVDQIFRCNHIYYDEYMNFLNNFCPNT